VGRPLAGLDQCPIFLFRLHQGLFLCRWSEGLSLAVPCTRSHIAPGIPMLWVHPTPPKHLCCLGLGNKGGGDPATIPRAPSVPGRPRVRIAEPSTGGVQRMPREPCRGAGIRTLSPSSPWSQRWGRRENIYDKMLSKKKKSSYQHCLWNICDSRQSAQIW
jgi:hypothetical protein